jgi:deazaflavin-dependent oxidoreductase (nitroreductase family)
MSERNEWNRRVIEEFRANEGRVGGPYANMPLVLLHHRGARTGAERINPLAYERVGDSVAVFASAGGRPKTPDWYHNVVANPDVTVELGTEQFAARARVTTGEERERIWRSMVARLPQFGEYEAKAGRTIPVVVLDPVRSERSQR